MNDLSDYLRMRAVFDVPIGTMIFPIKVNELQFLVFFDYEQAYQGFQNTDF